MKFHCPFCTAEHESVEFGPIKFGWHKIYAVYGNTYFHLLAEEAMWWQEWLTESSFFPKNKPQRSMQKSCFEEPGGTSEMIAVKPKKATVDSCPDTLIYKPLVEVMGQHCELEEVSFCSSRSDGNFEQSTYIPKPFWQFQPLF